MIGLVDSLSTRKFQHRDFFLPNCLPLSTAVYRCLPTDHASEALLNNQRSALKRALQPQPDTLITNKLRGKHRRPPKHVLVPLNPGSRVEPVDQSHKSLLSVGEWKAGQHGEAQAGKL